ncbi:low molecular weight phosphotyrosine protein phosphatase [Apiospora kogelbergensis]|uniref:low molecular weight phosphotyrosine protein phosphatase n=1 Tax=Apiospora kogelbergensis TaxID=1337665 RepID=UPI003130969C
MAEKISVLFVCLGNICRSTMAEGVFRSLTKDAPYKDLIDTVDSCGTGAYHAGDDPDDRTMSTLAKHGITDYTHAARKVRASDFDEFDYIFAMDRSNLSDLQRYTKKSSSGAKAGQKAKVMLFGEYSGQGKAEVVNDPYYGGNQGFQTAYEQCMRFSKNFLDEKLAEAGEEKA